MSTAYELFDNTIQKYLSTAFNRLGLNSNHTKIYNIIFDGIKGVMQNIMFYIEDAFTEQNIFTATRKNSVYSLAKISGYEPYYGSSASGTLIGTLIRGSALETSATKIFIPNETIVVDRETNTKYILQLSSNEYVIDVTKPLVSHEFKIVEGNLRGSMFSATGITLEVFTVIMGVSAFDSENITVEVNGEKWERAASLYDMGKGDKSYVINTGYDGSFDVMFGNENYGRVLRSGDNVFVRWLAHTGESGNILTNSACDFVFYTAGRDTFGNSVDINKFMILEMKNCVSGGTDPDDVRFIRSMVGYNSRSMVLATDDNFKLFFKRFSFIGRVNCWSHESTMKVIAVCTSNKITDVTTAEEYFAIDENELYISQDYKNQLISALTESNKTFAGISLEFRDPIFVRYAATCVVKVKDRYNTESIKNSIRNYLGEYFMNLPEGVQVIYKSDIIQNVLNNIDGMDAFDIHFISEKNEICYADNYYNKKSIGYYNGILLEMNERIYYDKDRVRGLDDYGNIVLDSQLEIPLLQGGFAYYDKENNIKTNSIRIETIQYIFL